MINVAKCLLILFLCCHSFVLGASPVSSNVQITDLYLDKGKRTDYAYKIVQDKQGYLWIATDNGLNRYDGYEYTQYIPVENNVNSIGSTSIVEMILHDNVLWLGGSQLSQYHPDKDNFTNYNVSDSRAIWALYQGNDEIMWVGGEGFGLRGFDIALKQVTHQYFNTPEARFIYDIVPNEKNNSLWISSSGGLFLFFPETGLIEQHLNQADLSLSEWVLGSLMVDNLGVVWIASNKGLITYNPITKSTQHYRHQESNEHSLSSDQLTNLYKDQEGNIWVGTDKKGLNLYDPFIDGFRQFLPENPNDQTNKLPPVAINDIYQDFQKLYWVATAAGVKRLTTHSDRFSHLRYTINDPQSLSFDNILALHQDKFNDIWIATDGGGLNKLNINTGAVQHFVHEPDNDNSLSSDSVISIDEDAQGNIWLGTYGGGLNKYNPKESTFSHFVTSMKKSNAEVIGGNDIFKVVIDNRQRVMLSVWRTGLQIYDPVTQGFTSYFPGGKGSESGISNYSINDIEPDEDGSYWIGGYNGLERFYPDKEIFIPIPLGGVNDVLDIMVDDNHIVWIATSQGLIKYHSNTNTLKRYTQLDGLTEEFIVSIVKDELGMFWLGSRAGLIQFDSKHETFKVLSKDEGLTSNEFHRGSHLYSSEGLMYFGGPKGINIFDPLNMKGNVNKPTVIFTDLQVNKQPVPISENGLLTQHISLTDSISLEHFQNDIILKFAALDFVVPQKNSYLYKLTGLEIEWNEVNAHSREVRYTNLKNGQYVFEVKAANNEGLWNEKSTKLAINIAPPWWRTWWAYSLFSLFTVLIIYGFIYWRLTGVKERANQLEKNVKARTHELAAAIDTLKSTQKQLVETEKMASLGGLVVGIAHEINTPLGTALMAVSSTSQQCEELFSALEENRLTKKGFNQAKHKIQTGTELSLNNINRIINLVVSFKKLAVWQSEEKEDTFNLNNILNDCVFSFSSQLSVQDISVNINCSDDIEVSSFPKAVYEVVNNLIGNSLTHGFNSQEQGVIDINVVKTSKEHISITYQDNGKGIDDDSLLQLFEPFFTTNRYGGNIGLGMHIVYNIITQQLGGTIVAEKRDKGLRFVMNIPVIFK